MHTKPVKKSLSFNREKLIWLELFGNIDSGDTDNVSLTSDSDFFVVIVIVIVLDWCSDLQ